MHVLADSAASQGVANATEVARRAVTQHRMPDAPAGFLQLYTTAMESGFHLAMLCAGLACLLAMALLLTLGSAEE
ncbi:hypothetical protein D3C72_2313580 [compost metagenome]